MATSKKVQELEAEISRLHDIIAKMMKCQFSADSNIDYALNDLFFIMEMVDAAQYPREVEMGKHEWQVAERDLVRAICELRAAKRCLGWQRAYTTGKSDEEVWSVDPVDRHQVEKELSEEEY